MLGAVSVDSEAISTMLVAYGKSLYYSGRPYGVYSESINAVVSRRGCLRRQLGTAWDLAFSWVADEPASHHPAMPVSVLLAISSLAMLWAWPVEAGIFLLTWAGLLRIGEVIGAYRRDLILPQERRELCVHCSASRHRRRGDVLRDTSRQGSIRVTWSNIWLTFLEATSVIRSCGLCLHRHCGRGSICYSLLLAFLREKATTAYRLTLGHLDLGGRQICCRGSRIRNWSDVGDGGLAPRCLKSIFRKSPQQFLERSSTSPLEAELTVWHRHFTAIRLKVQENLAAEIPRKAWQHLWSTPAFG